MLEFPRQLKGRVGSERTKAQSRWRQATRCFDAPLLWNWTWTRTMLVQGRDHCVETGEKTVWFLVLVEEE